MIDGSYFDPSIFHKLINLFFIKTAQYFVI